MYGIEEKLEQTLRARRAELLREAGRCEADLRAIAAEPESELEERAQGEPVDRVLARLDDRERREIAAINAALDRVADGTYGTCIRCGALLDMARLVALPEAALCLGCARLEEHASTVREVAPPRAGAASGDLALLGDRELEAVVRETIADDARVDDEELRIVCRHGVVHLAGVLPSAAQQSIVRQLVEDVLGLREVVDNVRVDETPWERADRTRPGFGGRPAGLESRGTDDDVVDGTVDGATPVPSALPTPDER